MRHAKQKEAGFAKVDGKWAQDVGEACQPPVRANWRLLAVVCGAVIFVAGVAGVLVVVVILLLFFVVVCVRFCVCCCCCKETPNGAAGALQKAAFGGHVGLQKGFQEASGSHFNINQHKYTFLIDF